MENESREEQIVALLKEGVFNHRLIAQRLKISRPRVSYLIAKLRRKGRISTGLFPQETHPGGGRPTCVFTAGKLHPAEKQPQKHPWRLHGQVAEIKILNSSPAYRAFQATHPVISFKGHKCQLFPDKLILHSFDGLEFKADQAWRAREASKPYWLYLAGHLERRLNILLLKGQNTRLRFLREHFADQDNEIAQDTVERDERLAFRANEDDKIYVQVDLSKGPPELEYLHPKTACHDADAIKPLLDDMRGPAAGVTFSSFKEVLKERFAYYDKEIKAGAEAMLELTERLTKLSPVKPEPVATDEPVERLKPKDSYFG